MPERPEIGDLSWAPALRAERRAAGGPTIAAVVNTRNEERNLPDCLASLAWVDELVVMDMHSDDATREIAAAHGARVALHDPVGYVEPARNAAVALAVSDWILIADADERATEPLARELDAIARSGRADVVDIPTRNWLCGRWLEATGWYGDWHPRFYRRGAVTWNPEIHSMPEIAGRVERLPVDLALLHFNYDDLHHFVAKSNTYTEKEADTLAAAGPPTWAEAIERARGEVLWRWSPEVDGTQSVALSMAMFFYRFLAAAKAWERHGYPDVGAPATALEALRDIALDPSALHAQGIESFAAGNHAQARDELEAAVRQSVDLKLLNDLAVVLHATGSVDRARAVLDVVVTLDPDYEAAWENLAALDR